MFKRNRHWKITWASWINFHPRISLRSITVLPSHPCVFIPEGLLFNILRQIATLCMPTSVKLLHIRMFYTSLTPFFLDLFLFVAPGVEHQQFSSFSRSFLRTAGALSLVDTNSRLSKLQYWCTPLLMSNVVPLWWETKFRNHVKQEVILIYVHAKFLHRKEKKTDFEVISMKHSPSSN